MGQSRKEEQKPQANQKDDRSNRPEGGARAKPMHEKDREDWEDKQKSKPLKTQH